MKIEKSCHPDKSAQKEQKLFVNIPVGTVFRHSDHKWGPYLKLTHGYTNLETHDYYPASYTLTLLNYMELPKARLVTGEDE